MSPSDEVDAVFELLPPELLRGGSSAGSYYQRKLGRHSRDAYIRLLYANHPSTTAVYRFPSSLSPPPSPPQPVTIDDVMRARDQVDFMARLVGMSKCDAYAHMRRFPQGRSDYWSWRASYV